MTDDEDEEEEPKNNILKVKATQDKVLPKARPSGGIIEIGISSHEEAWEQDPVDTGADQSGQGGAVNLGYQDHWPIQIPESCKGCPRHAVVDRVLDSMNGVYVHVHIQIHCDLGYTVKENEASILEKKNDNEISR